MARGDTFTIGQKNNPFYDFYERPRQYTVQSPDGPVHLPAITFLREINRGKVDCPDLPRQALAIANHYNILAREIIMDDVRQRIAPGTPSRKRCLWVVDDLGLAEYWQKKLGTKASNIVRLLLEGNFHKGDATLLLNDSEPISTTYKRAEQYWQGHMQDDPLPEILFEGAAAVLEDNVGVS